MEHRIASSRAWRALRALKYRVLGAFGVTWPRRFAALPDVSAKVQPRRGDKYDIVCFSIVEWDFRFQRPQQLMSRFAAAGHRVFYVSQLTRREGPAWAATGKAPDVNEVTFREKQLFASLGALRRDVSIEAAVMIVQLPFWWPLAKQAREQFTWPVIYDCMDLHAGFSTVRKAMVANEDALLAEADGVVASSAMLEQHARKHRDEVLLLRNGCDFEHFAKTPGAANARPVIGYYGAIADWFDSALVADLATRRPEWDFVLVGSPYLGNLSRLARLPNVSLPGEQPYASIPEWLGRFDVAIIPFRRMKLTEATNPVKVYEMLAAGKPIVSVPIPEVAALAPLVRLASTAEEFEREIVSALAEDDDEAAERRRAFAEEQTWEQRYDTLSAFLSRLRVFA